MSRSHDRAGEVMTVTRDVVSSVECRRKSRVVKTIDKFGAYRKAIELFDRVVEDLAPLREDFSLGRFISQQIASADSICANIEEGYGRLSRQEYIRFLDFSLRLRPRNPRTLPPYAPLVERANDPRANSLAG